MCWTLANFLLRIKNNKNLTEIYNNFYWFLLINRLMINFNVTHNKVVKSAGQEEWAPMKTS
jgi:hypothetical protein